MRSIFVRHRRREVCHFGIFFGSFYDRVRAARASAIAHPLADSFVEILFHDDSRDHMVSSSLELNLVEFLLDMLAVPKLSANNATSIEALFARYCHHVMKSEGMHTLQERNAIDMCMGADGTRLRVTLAKTTPRTFVFMEIVNPADAGYQTLKEIVSDLNEDTKVCMKHKQGTIPDRWFPFVCSAITAGMLTAHSEVEARGYLESCEATL